MELVGSVVFSFEQKIGNIAIFVVCKIYTQSQRIGNCDITAFLKWDSLSSFEIASIQLGSICTLINNMYTRTLNRECTVATADIHGFLGISV